MLRGFLVLSWVLLIFPPAQSQPAELTQLIKIWSGDTGLDELRSEVRDSLITAVDSKLGKDDGSSFRSVKITFVDSIFKGLSPETGWLIEEFTLFVYLHARSSEGGPIDTNLLSRWFESFIEHTVSQSDPERAWSLFPVARVILDRYASQCPDHKLPDLILMIDRLRLAEAWVYTLHLATRDQECPKSLQKWLEARVRISNEYMSGTSRQLDLKLLDQYFNEWKGSFPGIQDLIDQCVRPRSGGWEVPADKSWMYYFVTDEGSWVFTSVADHPKIRKVHLGTDIDWAGMIDRWYDGLLTYHTPRVFPKVGDYADWHKNWLDVNYELREKLGLDQVLDPEAVLIPDGPLEYFSWNGILDKKVNDQDERNFRTYHYLEIPRIISAGFWDRRKAHFSSVNTEYTNGIVMEAYARDDASYVEPLEYRREHMGDLEFLKNAVPDDVEFGSMTALEDQKESRIDWRALFVHIKLGGERSIWSEGQPDETHKHSFEWYALPNTQTPPMFMPATEVLPGPAVIRRLALSMKIWNTPGVLFCYWQIPEPLTKQFAKAIWPLWVKDSLPPGWLGEQGRELYSRGTSNLYQDPYFLDPWMYYTPFPLRPGEGLTDSHQVSTWGSLSFMIWVIAGLGLLVLFWVTFLRGQRKPRSF